MAEPQLVVITGKFTQQDGTPESGTVEFQVPGLLRSQLHNEGKSPGKFTRALDADGVFTMPVWSTDDPLWTPVGWDYRVTVNLSNYRDVFSAQVPVASIGGTLDMTDILRSLDPSKGSMYAPISHTHPELGGEGGGAVVSVAGRTGVVILSKADVGLSLVDNTSDTNKPVSSATQTALNLKANLASPTFTGTVGGITKSMVGLSNVDNTADSAKPVSTAQQTALDLKADASAVTTALGTKADLVGGVIPTSQIPALAVVEYLGVVANQAAMLAKVGQPGDWVNRSDTGTAWQITGADPTQIGNWTQLLYPASPVQSVAGKTGVVTLTKSDVGLANVDNTADANKSFTATQISNSTATGRSVITAADAAAARTAIGAGTLSSVPNPIPMPALGALPSAPAAGTGLLYTRDLNGGALLGYMGTSGVEYSVLRDVVFQVRNSTGVSIPKGTPVYITGYSSGGDNAIEVAPARASSATTMPVLGVTTVAIANNAYGGVMRFGRLDSVDTSAWAVRDLLYVSADTAGAMTNVQPATTATSQRVANVARVHASQGVLWVDVQTMLHNSAGSNRNTWTIGDGMAGVKSYRIANAAGTSSLNANPTAVRTWTLPDASGGVGLCPMVWNGSAYVEAPQGRTYVGPTDPGAVPEGSDWIDTDA